MVNDMQGKTVLITGGTSGLGEQTAIALARMGARVVLTGRDAARAAASARKIAEDTGGQLEGMRLDLESLADVRRFAGEFTQAHPRLDVLINNAGGGYPERKVTADGLEASMATNHFGPFLLTELLLPALKAAAPSRIITVSSGLHRMAAIDFEDLQYERKYKGFPAAYGRAKLAALLCTYELARRVAGTGVMVNVADPGLAATNYGKEWKGLTKLVWYTLMRPFQTAPEKAAQPAIRLASDPAAAQMHASYVSPPFKPIKSSPASYDEAAAAKLWAISETLTGVTKG